MFSPVSLNGYKIDFYFFLTVLAFNILTFFVFRTSNKGKRIVLIPLCLSILQTIGICIFLSTNTLQVNLVSNGNLTKNNVFAPTLTGKYYRGYYKLHKVNGCKDGEYWKTEVPIHFEIVEIEVERVECYKADSSWNKYTPE